MFHGLDLVVHLNYMYVRVRASRNIVVGTGHGITIGSDMSAGVKNVTFSNSKMMMLSRFAARCPYR